MYWMRRIWWMSSWIASWCSSFSILAVRAAMSFMPCALQSDCSNQLACVPGAFDHQALVPLRAPGQHHQHQDNQWRHPVDLHNRMTEVAVAGIGDHSDRIGPYAETEDRRDDDVCARCNPAHARQDLLVHDGVERRQPRSQHETVEDETTIEAGRILRGVNPDPDQRGQPQRQECYVGSAGTRKAHIDPVRQRA